ncbi:hypothetical protein FHS85_004117 [Rhodoligotrophos appendicifer]|uniref:hypothetical protein n=1 Tax=Rhodoligotrophos appendicifer TaxID=987056 RepID=UPI001185A62F|nr:hypothetical protein [Rhodoligotrophos appendicifer]
MLMMLIFVLCAAFAGTLVVRWHLQRKRWQRERSPNFRRRMRRGREPILKVDQPGRRAEDPDL